MALVLAELQREFLDFTFSTRAGARVRIVERPGRWMSAEARAQLLADLRLVVRASTPAGELDYGLLTDDAQRWDKCIVTLVHARDPVRPVAFNVLTILDCELRGEPVDVIHLGLVMIDPGYRAQGLSGMLYGLTCFLLFARQQMRPLWISNVTEVPAVFGMVAENFADVYPSLDPRQRRSFDHLSLAREIMRKHRAAFGVGEEAGFDERRFVMTNSYTGGSDNLKKTFEETAKHRRAEYNELCQRELDYARGDDFLQLGRFNLDAAKNYFLRSAPRLSPVALATKFAVLSLESAFLPVVHWFSADRALGELRPWSK
jgi:hypothetical protein